MNVIGIIRNRLCRPNILTGLLTLSSVRIVNHNCRTMANFQEHKDFFLSMPLEEKREQYACGVNYVTLDLIPEWKSPVDSSSEYEVKPELNKQISLFSGDITKLEIDAIVNAANERLAGGGGVDGFIHRAAGMKYLQDECQTLNGCETGGCKITGGYRLPAKYIIHCVGPIGEKEDLLSSCYETALNLAVENNIKTIAFPCISTGIYGYPQDNAAKVALQTTREWLEANPDKMERIIFCVFLPEDLEIYEEFLPEYFPA